MFDLTSKTAIVTGGTQGIGLGIAKAFHKAGASVVVCSESEINTAKAAATIGCSGIKSDVTRAEDLDKLIHFTLSQFGSIDILVCNAGVTGAAGSTSLDDFDKVISVNLKSIVALTNIAMPHMATREGASAILLSSISGLRGNATINAYALAKAGVAQLTRNLAVQWGPEGIRTNAISPGLIRTELSQSLIDDPTFMKRRMQMTPLRRAGEIEDIAGAALFLASRASSYVNGHNLVVDGGTIITDGS